MILSDAEKKKLNEMNDKIVAINKQILAKVQELAGARKYSFCDANDIDIENLQFNDDSLIKLIKRRNTLRAKYQNVAGQIWDERAKEEHYEEF